MEMGMAPSLPAESCRTHLMARGGEPLSRLDVRCPPLPQIDFCRRKVCSEAFPLDEPQTPTRTRPDATREAIKALALQSRKILPASLHSTVLKKGEKHVQD